MDSGPSDRLKQDSLIQDNGKKEEIKEKAGNFKFIKRNIKLAKCGHGTLSLTDEEKSRLENLLIDIDDSEVKNDEELKKGENFKAKTISENENKLYAMDEDTKTLLNQIDQQLEVYIEDKRLEENQSKISWIKHEERHSEENPNKKKGSNRLNEINTLLHSMNTVSNEEINPLSAEEIESLVQQSKESLSLHPPLAMGDKELPKPTEEVIAELLSRAKFLMPKFKYKFDQF